MNAVRDDLNPKFVFFSRFAGGALDASVITAEVDRAITAWCADLLQSSAPFAIAGDAAVDILNPVAPAGPLRIDLWVEDLDATSCTWGFLCSSENGATAYARGERTVNKLDPRSHRPLPWSDSFVRTNADLLRDFHAFA